MRIAVSFVHEDPDVALRLGQGQRAFQGCAGTDDVALRLMGERLQHQDLDQAPRPPPCFRRLQETLEQRLASRMALSSRSLGGGR